MNKESIQRFELTCLLLQYDFSACNLLCRDLSDGKNLWIRKIEGGGFILDAAEDAERVFLAIGNEGKNGQFTVLNKTDGTLSWFIPGRAYMFRIYMGYIYLIFADAGDNFFLIKTSAEDGSKLWHHPVNQGLSSYVINTELISLKYSDGSTEILSSESGTLLR